MFCFYLRKGFNLHSKLGTILTFITFDNFFFFHIIINQIVNMKEKKIRKMIISDTIQPKYA